jgi:hypothetical protein
MSSNIVIDAATLEWQDLLPQHSIFVEPFPSHIHTSTQARSFKKLSAIHNNSLYVTFYSTLTSSAKSTPRKSSSTLLSTPKKATADNSQHKAKVAAGSQRYGLKIRVLNLNNFKGACLKLKKAKLRGEEEIDLECSDDEQLQEEELQDPFDVEYKV